MNATGPLAPQTPPPPVSTRPIRPSDREPLARLICQDGLFTADEVAVALELIDGALGRLNDPGADYRVLVAESAEEVCGYVCFGPTPMTDGTSDLYWIVTDPAHRGRGVAGGLVVAMEAELRRRGGRRVRVETSSTELYGAAQRFYRRIGYPEAARLPDFYRPGDDLIILFKTL